MPVTLEDVARAVGVSGSTVSRALSNPDKVNPATRERVRQVARDMGYIPNQNARSLNLGRTDLIGLLVPDIANPFFPPIIKAVQARARQRGKTILVADTDERADDEVSSARFIRNKVDGLIVVSPRASDSQLAELASLTPIVFINREVTGATSVIVDAGDGMRQAVEHLFALGHRHIAYLNGPRRSWSNLQRRATVEAVSAGLGLTLTELGPFEPMVQSGVHAADLVIASGATAVIAYDDLIALGVLTRLNERGLRAGVDMSVIGVDDSEMSSLAYPSLSSVRVPGPEAGVVAVDRLMAMLENEATPAHETTLLDSRLIVRGSTNAPAPAIEGT